MSSYYKYFKYSFEEPNNDKEQVLYAMVRDLKNGEAVGHIPCRIPKGVCPAIIITELQKDLLEIGFDILCFTEFADTLKKGGK